MARILVTGATGQVGSFVCDELLAGGHEVLATHGPRGIALRDGVRHAGVTLAADRVDALAAACGRLDAVIHLAGKSRVLASWDDPLETFDANARLTVALLQRFARGGDVAFVHASSAEIFGHGATPVQNEETPIAPISPYGVSKAAAHMMVRVAREGMSARASNVVFYLGESERRPPEFVFRKITRGLAAVAVGRADHLALGDTSIVRDFCHARDLARAAVLVALGAPPNDYVCASGEGHTIGEVAETAARVLGLDPAKVVRSDPSCFRAADIHSLVGDASRLRALGWRPSLSFDELVRSLTELDVAALRADGEGR